MIKRDGRDAVAQQSDWRSLGLPAAIRKSTATPPRLSPAATPPEQEALLRHVLLDGLAVKPVTFTRMAGGAATDTAYCQIATPVGPVWLVESFIRHLVDSGHAKHHRERFAEYILPTLQNPAEVWRQFTTNKKGAPCLDTAYIAAYADINMVAVAREDAEMGALMWTFYPTKKINKRRFGDLIYFKG